MKKKIREQFILVKINSRESAQAQLSQMLADELKAEHIVGYEIETIHPDSIKYQITEDGKLVETFEDEDEARAEFERLDEEGNCSFEKIIKTDA